MRKINLSNLTKEFSYTEFIKFIDDNIDFSSINLTEKIKEIIYSNHLDLNNQDDLNLFENINKNLLKIIYHNYDDVEYTKCYDKDGNEMVTDIISFDKDGNEIDCSKVNIKSIIINPKFEKNIGDYDLKYNDVYEFLLENINNNKLYRFNNDFNIEFKDIYDNYLIEIYEKI